MKTKIMKLLSLLTVTIGLVATTNVWSQDSPTPNVSILPIQSPDATRELALGLVDHGSRAISAASIDWNFAGTKASISASGKGAEAVLDQLFNTELVYRLTNPEDVITGYVWLYDKNNNLIFFGSAQYNSSDLNKGLKPLYGVWIQEVPILENVSWAEVLALDADGKTGNRYPLRVSNLGQLMWQPWLSGCPNGILMVAFKNGTTTTYDLWNPIGETPTLVADTGGYKIPGHYVVNGASCPVGFTCISTLKIIEMYDRPTVLFRAPTDQQLSLDVMGVVYDNHGMITFERPYAVDITYESGESKTLPLDVNGPATVSLVKGELRLKFHWVKFALPGTLYAGPDNGGGGGIGKGVAIPTTSTTEVVLPITPPEVSVVAQ